MQTSKLIKRVGVAGLVKISLVAAIYVVLTVMLPAISYGPIQARVSELLNFLAFIDPLYIVGLTLGCAISNLYSTIGLADVIVGSAATFLSTYLMYKSRNIIIASLWPTIINCIFVSAELYLLLGEAFWASLVSIAIGEFFIMTIIGWPLFKFVLFKNKKFIESIKIDKDNKTYVEKLNF